MLCAYLSLFMKVLAYIKHFKQELGDTMVNEVEIGLNFVNERCNTSYSNPEDVIAAGEQLAVQLLSGEDVDYEFDSHRMAVSLFYSSQKVARPLESATMRRACELWLDRHSRSC